MWYPKPSRPRKVDRRRLDRIEYEAVTARDVSCRAPLIDPECDPCSGPMTREHVRPGGSAMGAPRVTDRRWMLILCLHHQLDGWATSHKPEERAWLQEKYPEG